MREKETIGKRECYHSQNSQVPDTQIISRTVYNLCGRKWSLMSTNYITLHIHQKKKNYNIACSTIKYT